LADPPGGVCGELATPGAVKLLHRPDQAQVAFLDQHGVDADRATRRLRALGVRVEPLTAADAVTADTAWAQLPVADLALTVRLSR
jgi:hypothetical protein